MFNNHQDTISGMKWIAAATSMAVLACVCGISLQGPLAVVHADTEPDPMLPTASVLDNLMSYDADVWRVNSSDTGAYGLAAPGVDIERQIELANQIADITERISGSSNKTEIRELEKQKLGLIAEGFENISHVPAEEAISVSAIYRGGVAGGSLGGGAMGDAWSYEIRGTYVGCNGASRSYNTNGLLYPQTKSIRVHHYYPSSVSIGTSPDCRSDEWGSLSLLYTNFATGRACKINADVSNSDSNWFICSAYRGEILWFAQSVGVYSYTQIHDTAAIVR